MKYSLTLFLALFGLSVFGQCSPTVAPQTIFYPNTTSTYSSQTIPYYLCGPNTVLWDTTSCYSIYCNASTTLNAKALCLTWAIVLLKSGAVINVLQNSATIKVYYENGAIINDPFSLASASLCPSIPFPNINCSAGLNEIGGHPNIIRAWPNPSNEFVNFEFTDQACQTADITIYDQVGKVVLNRPTWLTSDNKFSTSSLDNGSYFLSVKTSAGQQTQKLIIIR